MTTTEAFQQFSTNKNLPVYLQGWYLDIACSDGKWEVCFAEIDGQVVAIAPYFIKRKLKLSYITMPTLVKYMGPIFDESIVETDKQKLLDQMNLMLPSSSYFMQQWQPSMYNYVSTKKNAVEYKTRDTYLLDISQDSESILARMNDNYRRSIKKYSANISCDFRQKSTMREINQFISLLESTMGTLSNHKLTNAQVTKLVLALEKKSQGKLLSLYYKGELLASSLVSFDQQSAYYIFAANNKKFKKLYPGIQTAWQSILYLQENSTAKQLDFLGSSIESIAKIWKKLGASKYHYPLLETNPSPLFSLLNMGRNLWSKK